MDGIFLYPLDALASLFSVTQAVVKLCARMLTRLYLALHAAASYLLRCAETVATGCFVMCGYVSCSGQIGAYFSPILTITASFFKQKTFVVRAAFLSTLPRFEIPIE